MSVEFYGVERYVTGGMHVLSVRPVLARVDDNAAVDVSDGAIQKLLRAS